MTSPMERVERRVRPSEATWSDFLLGELARQRDVIADLEAIAARAGFVIHEGGWTGTEVA